MTDKRIVLSNAGSEDEARMIARHLVEQRNLFVQTVTYLVGIAVLLGLVLGRRHAHLSDLGWRMPRLRWIPVALMAAAISLVALSYLLDLLQPVFRRFQI